MRANAIIGGIAKNVKRFARGEITVAVPKKKICIGRVNSTAFTEVESAEKTAPTAFRSRENLIFEISFTGLKSGMRIIPSVEKKE